MKYVNEGIHLQAVYDEINAQRPDIVRHADTSRRSQKYRHDENVIASTPAMYRQVVVPAPGVKEYVTGKDLLAFAHVLCETEVILDTSPGMFMAVGSCACLSEWNKHALLW
jgi:hypothetical protein